MIELSHNCFCLVATIAVLSASCGYAMQAGEQLPVVTIDYKGQQVSVPYYEYREPVSDLKKDYDRRVMNEIGQIVQDMVRDALLGNKSFLSTTKTMMGHGRKLLKACNDNKAWLNEQRKKNAELGKSTKQGYMAQMGGLVHDIFDYDVCSAKRVPKPTQPVWCQAGSPSQQEREDHAYQISEYLNMFKAIVDKSPLGSYVDWRHMTIGNKTVVQAFGEEVSFFRRCGFSSVVTIMGWLSGSLKRM